MGEEETKQYEVTVSVDYTVTVDATSVEEAEALAYDQYQNGDLMYVDVLFVEEVG